MIRARCAVTSEELHIQRRSSGDVFFFSSQRRHTIFSRDWSSDVCSSDLVWKCRSLDPALPHPGIEGVFFWTRPPTRLPAGRDHRRPGLLQPRLHEGIELAQLLHEELSVEDGLLRTQVDAQFLGHRHDLIDVRDCVHWLLSFIQNAGRRNTRGTILRATSCPSLGEPSSWPFATMTFPLRITVDGQPSICQPSQGL